MNAGQGPPIPYCADDKPPVLHLRNSAVELGPKGIRVNSIHPGLIDTAMTDNTPPERKVELEAAVPLGRIGQPSDLVGPVVFLLSDESAYVTGAELVVDGGLIA